MLKCPVINRLHLTCFSVFIFSAEFTCIFRCTGKGPGHPSVTLKAINQISLLTVDGVGDSASSAKTLFMPVESTEKTSSAILSLLILLQLNHGQSSD